MRAFLLFLLLALCLAPAALAQTLPVITASDEARAHYERGIEHLHRSEPGAAAGAFDQARQADPGFALAHILYARYAGSAGVPWAERQPVLERALPGASPAERRFGEALRNYHAGAFAQGAQLLEGLVAEFLDEPFFLHNLGIMHWGAEDYDRAAEVFREGVERHPTFSSFPNDLAYTYLYAGRLGEAEAAFQDNARRFPDVANAHDSLGEFYLQRGRYDEAIPHFERAVALDPTLGYPADNLLRAHVERGNARFEEAFARQDAAAVAALYTEDATIFLQGAAPTAGGRAGVRDFWQGLFDGGFDGIELSTLDVRRASDVAYERGIATARQGGGVALVADYTALWRPADGGWQIHHDVITPTGGAASLQRADEVVWAEIIPGVAFGAVYGDWQAGAHGKLIRFAPGAAAPMHTHTHPYRGVVLSGRLTNPYAGDADPPEMGSGDAWYVPGGVPHSNACVSEEPCLFYTYGDAAWDIQVTEN